MKNSELAPLHRALTNVGNLKGVKFSYAVAKNMSIIEKELEIIGETKAAKDFLEFDKQRQEKRLKLLEKHAKKDEDGKPIKKENGDYELESISKFTKEVSALFEIEYEANKEVVDEYQKLLDQEAEIEFHKVKLENVPEDITTGQMNLIFPIIDES